MEPSLARTASTSLPVRLVAPEDCARFVAAAQSPDSGGTTSLALRIEQQPAEMAARAMYFDCVAQVVRSPFATATATADAPGDAAAGSPDGPHSLGVALLYEDCTPVDKNIADGLDRVQGDTHHLRLRVHELSRLHPQRFRFLLVARAGADVTAAALTSCVSVLSKGVVQQHRARGGRSAPAKRVKCEPPPTPSTLPSCAGSTDGGSSVAVAVSPALSSDSADAPGHSRDDAADGESLSSSSGDDSARVGQRRKRSPLLPAVADAELDPIDPMDTPLGADPFGNPFMTPLSALLAPGTAFMSPTPSASLVLVPPRPAALAAVRAPSEAAFAAPATVDGTSSLDLA